MRTLFATSVTALLILISGNAFAQNACEQISCDCEALPSDSWQASCAAREDQLKNLCQSHRSPKPNEFCALHGPLATAVPISISVEPGNALEKIQIVKHSHKLAAVYWSIHHDLEKLQTHFSAGNIEKSESAFGMIDNNVGNLFALQKDVAASYVAIDNKPEAEQSWRHYAEDSEKVGELLFDYGKAMFNATNSMENGSKKIRSQQLALNMLGVAGKVYEQSGYAYAQGIRHRAASEAWKAAANISVVAAEKKQNSFDYIGNPERDQRQAAMRLHRASYYWVVASGSTEEHDIAVK